jgi:hypothetical protein
VRMVGSVLGLQTWGHRMRRRWRWRRSAPKCFGQRVAASESEQGRGSAKEDFPYVPTSNTVGQLCNFYYRRSTTFPASLAARAGAEVELPGASPRTCRPPRT